LKRAEAVEKIKMQHWQYQGAIELESPVSEGTETGAKNLRDGAVSWKLRFWKKDEDLLIF
jgi:hypothetical protein